MSIASRPLAVIFDVDGTLIDSNDAHAHAWVDALTEAGHDVAFDEVRRLIGVGGDKLIPTITGLEHDSDAGERLSRRRREIFADRYLPHVRPFDGAGDLLRALAGHGHALAVATSAKKEELEPLLALTGAADVFDHRTSADDVDASKPDPDAVRQALQGLQASPDRVVMIGDTPYDLEAAHRAGVPFIAFRSGGWPTETFDRAVAVFAGPRALLTALSRTSLEVLVSPADRRA